MVFGEEPFPATVEGWLSLFQRNKILGLFYFNAPDILSIAVLGLLFLALFAAFKHINKTAMLIATFFSFLGIGVFVTTRSTMLSVLALSDQYAAAATDAQRSLIIGAGQIINALGNPTPQTAGFFFMAIAVFIISMIMLRGSIFGKVIATVGILTSLLTVVDDFSLVLVPSISGVLLGIDGGLWVIWWIMVSIRLFQLGHRGKETSATEKE
jgi:hypothetical protein